MENKSSKGLSLNNLLPIIVGGLLWILSLAKLLPYSIFELTHVEALLLAAPLWLIPMAWQIAGLSHKKVWLAVSFGLLFTIAYQLNPGFIAAGLIFPWLGLAVFLAFKKAKNFDRSGFHNWVELFAYLFLPVGIFWAIIDRLGIQLFGYDPTIILLTAVHFHYAGFILPQVTAWLIEKQPSSYNRIVGLGIMAGIPLVALGISSTHFQWPGWIEVVCVTIMTLAGAAVGLLYIKMSWKVKSLLQKLFFFIGGLSLIIGMALAFCYGWRHVFIIETLTIPWMYAVHGTCNAVGFAAPVLIGWQSLKHTPFSIK